MGREKEKKVGSKGCSSPIVESIYISSTNCRKYEECIVKCINQCFFLLHAIKVSLFNVIKVNLLHAINVNLLHAIKVYTNRFDKFILKDLMTAIS